jgi:hypothetical protein
MRALRALVAAVRAGRTRIETRLALARALHQAGYHDLALAAVARVLADHPEHPGAISVRACVAVCRGESEQAELLCRGVLARAPDCAEAREVLARVYFAQRRWEDLAACASRGVELGAVGSEARGRQLARRAQAWLALGRWDALSADIAALQEMTAQQEVTAQQEMTDGQGPRTAALLTALMLCRKGQWAEAYAESCRLLALPAFAGTAAELAAVRFESAHRMGRLRPSYRLSARQIRRLRDNGHEPWVARLIAECGLSPSRRAGSAASG